MQQTFTFTIKDNNGQDKYINLYCSFHDGRTGFQHRSKVMIYNDFLKDFNFIDKFYKVQYYNRTWESFTYESLLYHTIEALRNEKHITQDEYKQLYEKIKNLPYNLTYNEIVKF